MCFQSPVQRGETSPGMRSTEKGTGGDDRPVYSTVLQKWACPIVELLPPPSASTTVLPAPASQRGDGETLFQT
ncbi:hypothetical protein SKAU_G00084280 [Synaphobranchus kaupii]|uniref:Uncharacterized protein n=1 Tax=Synaphobranchus kaupii TaxID=118154 RepID=A0A9Q1J3L6_SYNKA|nr:hypothetical protein SKAU_G00084280 [Synaphobranchus kaupii]